MKGSVRVILLVVSSLLALSEAQAQAPDVEWAKTLQGWGAWSVQQTVDHGYILAGELYNASGHKVLHLIRTNEDGDTVWTRSFGSVPPSVYVGGRSVRECYDGSFIAAGYYELDVYVVKTNSGGAPLWTKYFIGYIPGYINRSSCVRETTDGGYVICGYSGVWGVGAQALIIKLDEDGNQEFLHTYGGTQYESANDIIQTPDSGYLAVGSVRPLSTDEWYDQYWILKINAEGGQEWFKVYGGSYTDIATAVCPAGDGGYLVAGYSNSYGAGDYDFYLMKLSSSGDSLWAKTYGSVGPARCFAMTQTGYDSFVLVGARTGGASNGKVPVVSVNANGDELWTELIPEDADVVATGYAVDATDDGGCIIAGTVTTNSHTYLMKLTPDVTAVDDRSGFPARYELYQNVPNPFNPTTVIRYDVPPGGVRVTLRVFDVAGRVVRTLADGVESSGQKSAQWDGRNESGNQVSTGVYFYRLEAGSFVETKKMVLLK